MESVVDACTKDEGTADEEDGKNNFAKFDTVSIIGLEEFLEDDPDEAVPHLLYPSKK